MKPEILIRVGAFCQKKLKMSDGFKIVLVERAAAAPITEDFEDAPSSEKVEEIVLERYIVTDSGESHMVSVGYSATANILFVRDHENKNISKEVSDDNKR